MAIIYLTPSLFEWQWHAETTTLYTGEAWRRPYQIWQHAESLGASTPSEFSRTDIITTLRRAVDHRVRMLMGLYDLRGIPLPGKPDGHLELLEYVGLVRPAMVQRLISIRNAVEHEDQTPPAIEECQVLTEFVWYFLRSTDRVTRSSPDSIEVSPEAADPDLFPFWPYSLQVQLGPEHGWVPTVAGRCQKDWLSNEPRDGWLTVQVESVRSGTAMIEDTRHSPEADFRLAEAVIEPEDVFLKGQIRGPAVQLREIIRMYFDLL